MIKNFKIILFFLIVGKIITLVYRNSVKKVLKRWWQSIKLVIIIAVIAASQATEGIKLSVPNNPISNT